MIELAAVEYDGDRVRIGKCERPEGVLRRGAKLRMLFRDCL